MNKSKCIQMEKLFGRLRMEHFLLKNGDKDRIVADASQNQAKAGEPNIFRPIEGIVVIQNKKQFGIYSRSR